MTAAVNAALTAMGAAIAAVTAVVNEAANRYLNARDAYEDVLRLAANNLKSTHGLAQISRFDERLMRIVVGLPEFRAFGEAKDAYMATCTAYGAYPALLTRCITHSYL